jgi:flagellar biogenesis protein FliO
MKAVFFFIISFSIVFCSFGYADERSAPNHTAPTLPNDSTMEKEIPIFPPEKLIGAPSEQTNTFIKEFIGMLTTLGLIISLMLIVAWFLKRMVNARLEQRNITSAIKITERRTLSPKTALYLLEVYDKTVLIAESQNGVSRLAEFAGEPAEPAESASNEPSSTSFRQLLESKNTKKF